MLIMHFFFEKNMRYSRSIGPLRQQDYEHMIQLLEQHLNYVQSDHNVTNDQINDVKLMIQKIQHHLAVPPRRDFTFYKYW